MVAGVEFRKLAPKGQAAAHQFGRLVQSPFAKCLDFAQLAQGSQGIGSVPVELAKVPQNGRCPSQKLIKGVGMGPRNPAVGAKKSQQLFGGAGRGDSGQVSHYLFDGPNAGTKNRLTLTPMAPQAAFCPPCGEHNANSVQRNSAGGRCLGDALQEGNHRDLSVEAMLPNIRCNGSRKVFKSFAARKNGLAHRAAAAGHLQVFNADHPRVLKPGRMGVEP